jgi:S-ribosylhomocysteine lyase
MENSLNRIPSFSVDHRGMQPGVYFREDIRNNVPILTADVRFYEPNNGKYLTIAEAHTIEHILATLIRSTKWNSNIIYFGPMGCRTGFYLLTTGMTRDEVVKLLQEGCDRADSVNEIPGALVEECGNYKDHDLNGAKQAINDFKKYIHEKEYKML